MRQVVLHPDHEDGGWVAEVPSLPGCVSQGQTKEEALRNVRGAIEQWEDAARSLGRAVPGETFDVQVCVV
jgi:predicted RNase H-like HicB family nuclease